MKYLSAALSVIVTLSMSAVLVAGESAPPKPQPAAVPQTTCPVLGGKINKDLYADYQGKRVYFCCAGCADEFKKDPAKYVKKLEDAGVTLEKTPAETKSRAAEPGGSASSLAGHGDMGKTHGR